MENQQLTDLKTKSFNFVEETAKRCYLMFGKLCQKQTNIKFYDINIEVSRIVEIAQKKGFKIQEFSAENKPDFNDYGYEQGYIWVYNPNQSDHSFHDVEHTRKWRYFHELAHGLTYKKILDKYSIPKVIRGVGALDLDRSIIALDWEIETLQVQYKMMRAEKIKVSKFAQNKESNTLMADLTHRCLTGEFLNPDLDGFEPRREAPILWEKKVRILFDLMSEGK